MFFCRGQALDVVHTLEILSFFHFHRTLAYILPPFPIIKILTAPSLNLAPPN